MCDLILAGSSLPPFVLKLPKHVPVVDLFTSILLVLLKGDEFPSALENLTVFV